MATIHRTTMVPSKLELLADWLPRQAWYRDTGGPPVLAPAGGFRLDDPAGEVGIECMFVTDGTDGETTYFVPLSYRGAPLDGADDGLIGTSEHGVLGTRWIYDAAYDPVAVTQLLKLVCGGTMAQHQSRSDTADSSVGHSWTSVSRPATSLPLRVSNDGQGGTGVAVDLVDPSSGPAGERTLDLVRVPQAGAPTSADGGLGHVEADWTRLDGTTARDRVAVIR